MGWFLPFVFILVRTKLRHQKHIILVFSPGVGYYTHVWGGKGTVWGRGGHLWILTGQWDCFWPSLKHSLGTLRLGQGLCSKVVFNLMILVLGAVKGNLREEKGLSHCCPGRNLPLLSKECFLVCCFISENKDLIIPPPPPHRVPSLYQVVCF